LRAPGALPVDELLDMQRTYDYLPEKATTAFQLDIQGLTKTALMGNSSVLPSFAAYQLALPLPYPDTTL